MKLKKTRKSGKFRGSSSHGWGSRKKHISSGNQGGFGMSGTGKTAGHRKSQIINLYGTSYFGTQGVTSRGTKRRKNDIINVGDLELKFENLKAKHLGKDGFLNLEGYKILGQGEIKSKIKVKAKSASKSAKEKIEKAGGTVVIEGEPEKDENSEK